MKCYECNKDMKEAKEDYQYKESGLNNVVLESVSVYRCECGEYLASIPAIIGLNSIIALSLFKKKTFLKGEEIRYLRKNAGLNAKVFAEYIGVNKSTLSRWENNKQVIDKSNDRLIRFVYANIKGVSPEEIKSLLDDVIKEIRNCGEEVDINIPVGCFSKEQTGECGIC